MLIIVAIIIELLAVIAYLRYREARWRYIILVVAVCVGVLSFLKLYGDDRPKVPISAQAMVTQKETSAGTPINEDFDMKGVDLVDTPGSECFSEVGYDDYNCILVVTFRDSGSTYAYYGISYIVWSELTSASSMGGYYNKFIKGKYECEKIE